MFDDTCDYVELDDTIDVKCEKDDQVIMHLNIRGLCSKQQDLANLLKDCIPKKKKDVVLLVETWTTTSNFNTINIPGYKYYGQNRNMKKGEGVSIPINEHLKCKIAKKLSCIEPYLESLFLEIMGYK